MWLSCSKLHYLHWLTLLHQIWNGIMWFSFCFSPCHPKCLCTALVITLLSGNACEWGTAVWERTNQIWFQCVCGSHEKIIWPVGIRREATRWLLYICQGTCSVSHYAFEFWTLGATAGLTQSVLIGGLRHCTRQATDLQQPPGGAGVCKSPHVPVVFGRLWFIRHNRQVDWTLGTIPGWSPSCLTSCLQSASSYPLSSLPVTETPPDLSSMPAEYHNLVQVFCKTRACSLPPHSSYNCAINLLPGTMPPRGCLFSLSTPETQAMEKYIGGVPGCSSSPAGARFFFVEKKDHSLWPCIDYRWRNDITIKKKYGAIWLRR